MFYNKPYDLRPNNGYPYHWTEKHIQQAQKGNIFLFYLDQNSNLYKTIHNFVQDRAPFDLPIKNIVQIVNVELFDKYNAYRKSNRNYSERYLFHGTREVNVNSIAKHGFLKRMNTRHPGNKTGTFFTFSVNYALSFAFLSSYCSAHDLKTILIDKKQSDFAYSHCQQGVLFICRVNLSPEEIDDVFHSPNSIVCVPHDDASCAEFAIFF